jgi:hypothetical protein
MTKRQSSRTRYAHQEDAWHLDKKVPLGMIGAILIQSVGLGMWIGGISKDVASLQSTVTKLEESSGKIARLGELDVEIRNMRESMNRIEATLERYLDRTIDVRSDVRKRQ